MNPFETHGIAHLSASSLNTYAAQPAAWVAQKLLKKTTPVGAAAHRGTAIEAGVALALTTGVDDEEAAKEALRVFNLKTAFSGDARKEKEHDAVAPSVATALSELRPYGPDVKCQEKISWMGEGIEVPFIGFVDFYWPKHGILIDLKTQLRLNSEIKIGHARQVGLYAGALGDNVDARLTYVTPKKAATYGLENASTHVASLLAIAHTLRRFLSISSDPRELAALVLPDTDSFYWSDSAARATAWEIWGV